MNYPGNETLAEEIRERILNTFRQTLELAQKGDRREAQLGCDFVLRLDPLFEPARELSQRLEAENGPVEVEDLRGAIEDLRGAIGDSGGDSGGDTGANSGAEASVGEAALGAAPESLDPFVPPAPGSAEVEPGPEAGVDSSSAVNDLDTAPSPLDSALDLSSLKTAPEQEALAAADTHGDSQTSAAAPSEPPPVDENSTRPGTEPIATLDNESEQRVKDLLNEGQAAFETAEYQSAIDSWSRIFLIDIDHPEANRRIDLARKLKAEVERKVEESYHDALEKVESGRLDEARGGFEAVLQMMPGHIAAREYLDRLDAPDFVAPVPVAEPSLPSDAGFDEVLNDDTELADGLGDVLSEPLHKPVSSEALARPSIGGVGRASKEARSPKQTFRIVGAAGLVVLALGGWFLYKNWNSFFPNASDASAPVQLDPIARAKKTYAEAGGAIAIAQLRRLSPGHPQYAEAQALLAKWEATLDANQPQSDMPEPEALAARDRLVGEARAAFAENRFLLAEKLLERGSAQASLDAGDKELLEQARDNLGPLQAELTMFREGEWEMSLRGLWRIWESGTTTPDVRQLMVDSYFNLGVRDLQRQDAASALSNFKEAQELGADDAELSRLIEFAETYQERSADLLYRIFVKYLPFR